MPGIDNPNRLIRNPILVVEGIDFHDVAPHIQIDGINYEDISFKFNLYSDLAQLSTSAYNRDLVVLNFNQSTNAIQSNAELFKEVLAYINNPSNRVAGIDPAVSKTVVVGISMGGLVSRLGLAQLVAANNGVDNTNVSLLYTHDSPHYGANIPLSFQILARAGIITGSLLSTATNVLLGGVPLPINGTIRNVLNYTYSRELKRMLNCDASENMLLAKFKVQSSVLGAYYNNPWLEWYQNQVREVPGAQYRFVPVSIGSECLFDQQKVSGRTLFDLSGTAYLGLGIGGFRLFDITGGGLFHLQGMPEADAGGEILALRIYENVRVLSFENAHLYNRQYNLCNLTASVVANDGHQAWDFMAGGYYPLRSSESGNSSINAGIDFKILLFGEKVFRFSTSSKMNRQFCYIPEASALSQNAYDASSLKKVRNYYTNSPVVLPVANGRIANFATEPTNYSGVGGDDHNFQHARFILRSSSLLFSEIVGSAYNEERCATSCAPSVQILGPSVLCPSTGGNSATIQLSITPPPAGNTIVWGTTDASIISGQGTNIISVSSALGDGQSFKVGATIRAQNGCTSSNQRFIKVSGFATSSSQPTYSGGVETWLGYGAEEYMVVNATTGPWVTLPPAIGEPPITTWNLTTPSGSSNCVYTRNHCQPNYYGHDITNYFHACGPRGMRQGGFDKNPVIYNQDIVATAKFYKDELSTTPAAGPMEGALLDERNQKVWTGASQNNEMLIDIQGLKPAQYKLIAANADDKWNFELYITSAGKHLTVSPNPARQNVDDSVSVSVASKNPKSGPFSFTLSDFMGTPIFCKKQDSSAARLPLQGLKFGTYQVIVADQDTSWTEDVDFLYKNSPYMTLSPNPATSILTSTINDPLYTTFKGEWKVIESSSGQTVASGITQSSILQIDVSQFPTGVQLILRIEDGYITYNKHFQVIR